MPITTFPNPFSDRISVRLENVNEGKAVIQLLDFSGNVLRSDMVFVKNHEGEITFETRDIDAGYYALRVIQGDSVKNTTIMTLIVCLTNIEQRPNGEPLKVRAVLFHFRSIKSRADLTG